jgi:hypothetical protein
LNFDKITQCAKEKLSEILVELEVEYLYDKIIPNMAKERTGLKKNQKIGTQEKQKKTVA